MVGMWEIVKLGSIQFSNEVLKFRYYHGRVKLVNQNHMGEISVLGFTPDLLDRNHRGWDLHFMKKVLRALLVKPAHRRFKSRTSIWDVIVVRGSGCSGAELQLSGISGFSLTSMQFWWGWSGWVEHPRYGGRANPMCSGNLHLKILLQWRIELGINLDVWKQMFS